MVCSQSFFFSVISRRSTRPSPLFSIWKMNAPPRVVAFGWIALCGGILTMNNLSCGKRIMVNACPVCLVDEETVDHLLLRCRDAKVLRSHFLRCFDCRWAFAQSIREALESCHLRSIMIRGKLMWRSAFWEVLWTILKERSARWFEGKKSLVEDMINR